MLESNPFKNNQGVDTVQGLPQKRYLGGPPSTLVVCSFPFQTPQREQLDALQKKWIETKAQAEKEYGTSAHLELPDIIIRHEFTYEAPPGKATADRAKPLPRAMVS